MIEVLVAIVILAFGLLGLAGLQTRTIAVNQSSLYRSQATALTDDILDRMRADRANARNHLWDTGIGTAAGSISGSAIYQSDLRSWKLQVENLLPGGRASVTTNGNQVQVVIEWDDTRGREGPQQLPTESQL